MSLKALTWAFDQVLPPNEKVVLLAIADYADDYGYAFPGISTIARKASMHERTVIRMIAKLEERGLLGRERRHLQNGNRTSDGYQLQTNQVTDHHMTEPGDKVTTVSSTGEPSVEPSVRKKAATRLPADWVPSNAHRVQAQGKGVNVDLEAEKFRDWCLANDARKADWEATFRNWIRNARPEPGGGVARQRPGSPPRTPTDRMNAVMALSDPTEMRNS